MKSFEAQAYWQPLNLAALFKRGKKEEQRRKSVCKQASLAPLTPNTCIPTIPSSLLLCHCVCSWSAQNEYCFHHFLLGRYWSPVQISSLEVPSLTPQANSDTSPSPREPELTHSKERSTVQCLSVYSPNPLPRLIIPGTGILSFSSLYPHVPA